MLRKCPGKRGKAAILGCSSSLNHAAGRTRSTKIIDDSRQYEYHDVNITTKIPHYYLRGSYRHQPAENAVTNADDATNAFLEVERESLNTEERLVATDGAKAVNKKGANLHENGKVDPVVAELNGSIERRKVAYGQTYGADNVRRPILANIRPGDQMDDAAWTGLQSGVEYLPVVTDVDFLKKTKDALLSGASDDMESRKKLLELFRMRLHYYWTVACGWQPRGRTDATKPKSADWFDEASYYKAVVADLFDLIAPLPYAQDQLELGRKQGFVERGDVRYILSMKYRKVAQAIDNAIRC
ncbi:unnamed protein product [Amoebophrya sp. A25]|nr:unnamed protein product [Amoebophrya sp. A25]|eukprot:GSA25T00017085001.1